MEFEEMVKNSIIFTRAQFDNAKDAISFLAQQLKDRQIVKETFLESVLEREKKYPTGLYLGKINVAIPHTDTEHVLKSGLAIATLTKPVMFRRMDRPEQEIPVSIIFVLAVLNPKEYIKFLSKLTTSFGNGDYIEKMFNAQQPKEIIEILKIIFEEEAK